MTEELEDYVLSHIDPEPENLRRLNRRVQTSLLYPRMCSGHLQGRILKMIVRMVNPLNVLELGTYAGYSALCLAEGLSREYAKVTTIEIDDEMEDFIREQLAASPFGDRVELIIGDALKLLPTIDRQWDLVYVDANKRLYVDYYNLLIERLSPGAFIVADNTLWDGHVADTTERHDAQTLGIMAFNDLVAADSRVEKVIVPLRDGLTIIRKI